MLTMKSAGIPSLFKIESIDSYLEVPPVFKQVCQTLDNTRYRGLELVFVAMFVFSNSHLDSIQSQHFRIWLATNVNVSRLCKSQSWAAKGLLTHLLYGAVEIDNVTVLKRAHAGGADFNCRSSFESERSLLQHSIVYDSVQCAEYLIHAGADVGNLRDHGESTDPLGGATRESSNENLLAMAARSHECVELVRELLECGASPKGIALLGDCVRSGATSATIQALIRAGVSPDEDGALSVAASLGRCEVMETLLSARASTGAVLSKCRHPMILSYNPFHEAPIIAAIQSGRIDAIEILIRHNVDLSASWLEGIDPRIRQRKLYKRWIARRSTSFIDILQYPIQEAVKTGSCDLVEFMISKGVSLIPKHGKPLLLLATEHCHLVMMKFLLAKGHDVNAISEAGPGYSALAAAAGLGWLEGMSLLLEAGAQLELCSQRSESRTPIQLAAERGEWDAVELLLAKGADMGASPCSVDGLSVLQPLISCGRPALMFRALAAGVPLNISPGTKQSPLLRAVEREDIDLVRFLLRFGADVSQPAKTRICDPDGRFLPLQLAAELGSSAISKLLIDHGADVDGVVPEENERTPLTLACGNGNRAVAQYLISRGANLCGRATSYDGTPLYHAIRERHVSLVRCLLENGTDANHFCLGSKDCGCKTNAIHDSTPLLEVCEGDCMFFDEDEDCELTILLMDHGADVNFRPSLYFNTILQTACFKDELSLAKLLLSRGAEINAPFCAQTSNNRALLDGQVLPKGFSALQAAIMHQNVELVDFLLLKGADVHAVAISARPEDSAMVLSPFQVAAMVGDINIAERLLKAGARIDERPYKPKGRTAIQGAAEFGRLEMLNWLLYHYRGTRIDEICDDAVVFAQKRHHHHVVGFLREYKNLNICSPAADAQDAVEVEEWVDWIRNTPENE